MEESNRISKHIEITVNAGNYQNIKIGTFLNLEIETGETVLDAHRRISEMLSLMLQEDIGNLFRNDDYLRRNALSLIGIQELKSEGIRVQEEEFKPYDPEENDDFGWDYDELDDDRDDEDAVGFSGKEES